MPRFNMMPLPTAAVASILRLMNGGQTCTRAANELVRQREKSIHTIRLLNESSCSFYSMRMQLMPPAPTFSPVCHRSPLFRRVNGNLTKANEKERERVGYWRLEVVFLISRLHSERASLPPLVLALLTHPLPSCAISPGSFSALSCAHFTPLSAGGEPLRGP